MKNQKTKGLKWVKIIYKSAWNAAKEVIDFIKKLTKIKVYFIQI